LVRPPWLVPAEASAILVLGLATGLFLRWRVVAGAACALALLISYLGATQLVFTVAGVVCTTVYATTAVMAALLAGPLCQSFFGERARRRDSRALRAYVGSDVAELLAREPGRLRIGGEQREILILFTDIRGFSTISEQLAPGDLSELLTEHLGA